MGIHHTYKSQAGERAFKKQGKQLERQRRSRNRKILKQQQIVLASKNHKNK